MNEMDLDKLDVDDIVEINDRLIGKVSGIIHNKNEVFVTPICKIGEHDEVKYYFNEITNIWFNHQK